MLAPYVKAYVKRQKNDAADAEAICEAVTQPAMKSPEQQSIMVLLKARQMVMRQGHEAGEHDPCANGGVWHRGTDWSESAGTA